MSQLPIKLGATTTPQVDEYGNPIQHGIAKTGHGTGGKHDSARTGVGYGTGAGTFDTGPDAHQQPHTTHRRSGSSGSSSSEDDGQGGRRKKGLTQKIKEKLPGGHHDQGSAPSYGSSTAATNTAPGGVLHQTESQEKKGMMDKIKEKLPGKGAP
ncbi:dehydrin Rab18-like [Humulus lupulus]|uniref:dehydrin Rab18-like n=1 Tax=Humulus lupulus TaxID=3486 RepID=UPI002B4073D6|nr:dehydrin Rab18-like [Humulus lupulus]